MSRPLSVMARENKRNRTKRQIEKTVNSELTRMVQDTMGDPAIRVSAIKTVSTMKSHSGPIPSPEAMKEYDSLCPGLANRIFEEAAKESQHRRDLEKTALEASIADGVMPDLARSEDSFLHSF
ncbi:MAG: DUF2335 domain-containing protein [Tepidisphaeraceae bacterium]